MQAMSGPYVVSLYGWFQDDSSVWLVMEWCEGGDLFKCMMMHGGRLDEYYVCSEIVAPLLRVLEKSHRQCFMHRDIKVSCTALRLAFVAGIGQCLHVVSVGMT